MTPSISVTEAVILEKDSELQNEVNKKTCLQSKVSTLSKHTNMPTFEEIRRAIPLECFEKSLSTSLFYLVLDYVIIAMLYCAVPYIEFYAGWLGLMAWYWVMGIFLSSLFIIGHDCGHTTFSNYRWINDIVGHLTHGPLMAPYWPWQKTHRQHHQYTGHLEKDKGHPWVVEEEYKNASWLQKNFSKIPISGFFRWNPVYTLLGLPDGSHFWPFSKIFTNNTERLQCIFSGSVCAFFTYVAFFFCNYSAINYLKYYYIPILFQSFWMVMITYLQHQDEEVQVFEEGYWSFVTGQTQTFDRYYGFGIDKAMHHITDGHVAHHFFFTKIPHYHLPKATQALRKVFSRYPGVYKSRNCYHHAFEFLRLNVKLEYLVGKGTGLLMYKCKENEQKKKNE